MTWRAGCRCLMSNDRMALRIKRRKGSLHERLDGDEDGRRGYDVHGPCDLHDLGSKPDMRASRSLHALLFLLIKTKQMQRGTPATTVWHAHCRGEDTLFTPCACACKEPIAPPT
eukprot:scaffold27698_cov20-Tisochrysis_lutea.AAC.2